MGLLKKAGAVIVGGIILSGCLKQTPYEKDTAKSHHLLTGSEDIFLKIDKTDKYDSPLEEKFINTADRGYQINPELADSMLTDYFFENPVTESGLEDVDSFLEFYEKYPEQTEKLIDQGITGPSLVEKIKNPTFVKAYTSGISLDASLNLANIQYDGNAEKYIAKLIEFSDNPEIQKSLASELRGTVKTNDLDWIGLPQEYLNAVYGDGTADMYEKQHGLAFSYKPDIQKVVLSLPQSLDGITPQELSADEWLNMVINNEEANKRLEKIRIRDLNDPTGNSDKILSYPLDLTKMTEYQLTPHGVGIIITRSRDRDCKYTDFVGQRGFKGQIDPDGAIDQVNVASMLRLSGNESVRHAPDLGLSNWDKEKKDLKSWNKTIKVIEERFYSGVDKKLNNVIFFDGKPFQIRQLNISIDKNDKSCSSDLFIDLPNTTNTIDLGISYYPNGIVTDFITKYPSITEYGITIPSSRLGIFVDVILFDKNMNMIFGLPEEYKEMHPIEHFKIVYASGFPRFLVNNPEAIINALSLGI